MNKIMTGLTLLASLGLASIGSQAHAGERHQQRDDHNYVSSYNHEAPRAYRDARRDHRQHRREKWQRHHSRDRYQYRHHTRRHNAYNSHGRHRRSHHHRDYNWRVIFKF